MIPSTTNTVTVPGTTNTVTVPATTVPATTAPATTRPAVDIAFDKLSLSNIQNLWNEKVANVSFFAKIPGFFSYLWNKSTAVEADKAHGATIELFNSKLADLVTALSERALTTTEATTIGVSPVQHGTTAAQKKEADLKLTAERKEREFYDVFKTRCSELNVDLNSGAFIDMAHAASEGLVKFAKSEKQTTMTADGSLGTLLAKIKTASVSFNGKIYNDMVQAYSSQVVANITPENFKAKVADLKAFFATNTVESIEANLRKAIATANNKTTMTTLSAAYLDAAVNNPKVAEVKTALKVELDASKADIDAKMLVLRGANTNNGSIHTAHLAQVAAQAELTGAETAFRTAFGSTPTAGSALDVLLSLDIANGVVTQVVKDAHAALVAKNTAFVAAKKACDDLKAELAVLAVWTGGNITGGTFHEVTTKLAALDLTARTKATKLGDFFAELKTDVVAGQEAARSTVLNAIIDRP